MRLTALIDRYGADMVRQAIAEMRHRAERQMRARIADIPDGVYEGTSYVDSDGVVDEPLTIRMKITKKGEDLLFDMTGSSPPCRGPMNSVIATTKSAIYLAVKHIFPDVPINAGTFEPLKIVEPEGTFLYARYPRPVSGCAAEVSQRIAEAVFAALTKAIPDLLFAAPAGTSGNLGVGGYDPERGRSYIMYLFTGGGYGGFQGGDGLSNGCSTIGISKMPPIEVLEQFYPVLFEEFSLCEGSGGAGEFRGGFGINYAIKLRRGEARVSMVMDHGRTGPQGVLGGSDGGTNTVEVSQGGRTYRPPHLSKDQDIEIGVGDVVRVSTPGGGGFGDPAKRKPEAIARDVAKGYYSEAEAREKFGTRQAAAHDTERSKKHSVRDRMAIGAARDALALRRPARRHSSSSHRRPPRRRNRSGMPCAGPTIRSSSICRGSPSTRSSTRCRLAARSSSITPTAWIIAASLSWRRPRSIPPTST